MKDKRPHVETITCSVGEHFYKIENGEAETKPDADYRSMVISQEKKRQKKSGAKIVEPTP